MIQTPVTPPTHLLTIPPFRPRTPRQQTGLLPRFNHRVALFYGINSRQPPRASHAACARYCLSRKFGKTPAVASEAPNTTTQLTQIHTHLSALHNLLTTLLNPFPPPSSTFPTAHPAPVVSMDPRIALISFIEASSSSSTPLQGPSEARAPSRPYVDFGGLFGG